MKFCKKLALVAMTAVTAISVTSCDYLTELLDILLNDGGEEEGTEYVDKWAGLVNETVYDAVVDGNTLTYGTHKYTVSGEINYDTEDFKTPTAFVTFTNVPSGYAEFEAVYKGLLGKSLQGTAAMVPMAMEIYARHADTGERCFELLCDSNATVSGIIRILKTKIVPSEFSPEDDSYIQRFLPAASLKGAVYTNAYTPAYPYTVQTCASPNKFQEKKMSPYGTVYYTYIIADGWDTTQRAVDLFLPLNETLYKVNGCASCYTQCKDIQGTWGGLK